MVALDQNSTKHGVLATAVMLSRLLRQKLAAAEENPLRLLEDEIGGEGWICQAEIVSTVTEEEEEGPADADEDTEAVNEKRRQMKERLCPPTISLRTNLSLFEHGWSPSMHCDFRARGLSFDSPQPSSSSSLAAATGQNLMMCLPVFLSLWRLISRPSRNATSVSLRIEIGNATPKTSAIISLIQRPVSRKDWRWQSRSSW